MASISRILHGAGFSWKVLERRTIQLKVKEVALYHGKMSSVHWDLHMLIFGDEISVDNRGFFFFCKKLALSKKVEAYPGRNSVWIMHHHLDANLVNYLRHLGLKVLFLPSYAPFYFPIEFVFGFAKKMLIRVHKENAKSILTEVA